MRIIACQPHHLAVEVRNLSPDGLACLEQRLYCGSKFWPSLGQLCGAHGKHVHLCLADDEPKILEESADLVFNIPLDLDEQSSADKKGFDRVTVDVVEESDGDLMGDGVNIAARLEGIAKPGAVCLSEDAYRQVKSRLDLAVSDLGPTQLKNIVEPIRVYSLQVGLPAQAKPAVPLPPTPAQSSAPHLSIVVLPLRNLSNDPSQDYFADGITENLTTDLSRIRNSFVIARNTAFTFKGKNIPVKETSKELGVRYVLEGSVQRDQTRVRVNAQLIDGETGAHLWADEEDVADLFKLQDQVVARLANALSYELVKAEAEKDAGSQNPDVVDLVMRGKALMWPPFTKDRSDTARAWFEKAQ